MVCPLVQHCLPEQDRAANTGHTVNKFAMDTEASNLEKFGGVSKKGLT